MKITFERERRKSNVAFQRDKSRIPFAGKVWLSSPTMHGEELKYMQEAYETNWMSTVGKNINEVERLIGEKVNIGSAVALSSGTAALHMAVKLAGVKPGDYVFCSDMTFAATVNPVLYEGGIPFQIRRDSPKARPKAGSFSAAAPASKAEEARMSVKKRFRRTCSRKRRQPAKR